MNKRIKELRLHQELQYLADVEYAHGDLASGSFVQKLAYAIKVRAWAGKKPHEQQMGQRR